MIEEWFLNSFTLQNPSCTGKFNEVFPFYFLGREALTFRTFLTSFLVLISGAFSLPFLLSHWVHPHIPQQPSDDLKQGHFFVLQPALQRWQLFVRLVFLPCFWAGSSSELILMTSMSLVFDGVCAAPSSCNWWNRRIFLSAWMSNFNSAHKSWACSKSLLSFCTSSRSFCNWYLRKLVCSLASIAFFNFCLSCVSFSNSAFNLIRLKDPLSAWKQFGHRLQLFTMQFLWKQCPHKVA